NFLTLPHIHLFEPKFLHFCRIFAKAICRETGALKAGHTDRPETFDRRRGAPTDRRRLDERTRRADQPVTIRRKTGRADQPVTIRRKTGHTDQPVTI
ncbi:hypothetical protein, partial [Paenibacillus cisolokensis]|uniref:hypothetical protein n=1 Tax=Paenibacillus cisolokensis TaxID=1658519 RepID=UPI001BD13AEA